MPRPGAVRRRATSGSRTAVTSIGRFEVYGSLPGQPRATLVIDPTDFGEQSEIIKAMASIWYESSSSRSFASSSHHRFAIVNFAKFLAQCEVEAMAEVTPDILRDFERHLVDTVPGVAPLYSRFVWAVLRQVKGLPADTVNFVSHAPPIAFRSGSPTAALPDSDLKLVLRTARRDVTRMRDRLLGSEEVSERSREQESALPWWHETMSIFVLLLFETALSVDVLWHLNFQPDASTRVSDWSHGSGQFVELSYVKRRGGAAPPAQLLSTEGTYSAGSLLRLLRDATETARRHAEGDARLRDVGPWLGLMTRGVPLKIAKPAPGQVPLIPIASIASPFATWLAHHGLQLDAFDSRRITFRAIRPAAKYQRLRLTDTSGLHMVDLVDDHTVDVYSRRYMRNKRLMHDLGRVFLENISGVAEEVARHYEPTVVTPEMAEDDEGHASAALDGDLEFGLTACKTPTDSPMPGQRSGDLCGLAFRACLVCPSAIVSPRHVTRLRTILAEANRQREIVPPPEWELMWGETVAFIEQALARLAPYENQFPQEPANIIDVGLLGGDA